MRFRDIPQNFESSEVLFVSLRYHFSHICTPTTQMLWAAPAVSGRLTSKKMVPKGPRQIRDVLVSWLTDGVAWWGRYTDSFLNHWSWPVLLTRIDFNMNPTWISNYIACKVWDEITYPFPNFNGCTIDVCEWICNFTPYLIMKVITYPYWIAIKTNSC